MKLYVKVFCLVDECDLQNALSALVSWTNNVDIILSECTDNWRVVNIGKWVIPSQFYFKKLLNHLWLGFLPVVIWVSLQNTDLCSVYINNVARKVNARETVGSTWLIIVLFCKILLCWTCILFCKISRCWFVISLHMYVLLEHRVVWYFALGHFWRIRQDIGQLFHKGG